MTCWSKLLEPSFNFTSKKLMEFIITFRVSVLLGDRYWVLTSDRLIANPFRK